MLIIFRKDFYKCKSIRHFSIFLFWLNLLGWHWFHVYNSITHHTYTILHVRHTKSSLLLSPTTFYLSPPPFPSGNHHTVVYGYKVFFSFLFFFFCLIPSPVHPASKTPLPSDSCQSVLCVYESVSIFFVSWYCSLDSTYKWDHTIFVSPCLAYVTYQNILQVPPCCHKRWDFLLFFIAE